MCWVADYLTVRASKGTTSNQHPTADLPPVEVISPDFPLELTGFFQGKHLIQFLVLKMKDFRNFFLDNCILEFDAEQVYLKPQVINLKNKEVTANPTPQTLEKKMVFRKP